MNSGQSISVRSTRTAEVSFDHDTQLYAHVAINGHPSALFKKPHTYGEMASYFALDPPRWRFALYEHFGDELSGVFDPDNNAAFEYRGEVAIDGLNLEVFGFQVKKPTVRKQWDKERDQHLPGFGLDWGGPGIYTGVQGLIWIDKATSGVRRVVLHHTEIDSKFPIAAASSSTNYGLTPIAGLGEFLLPSAGEDLSCNRDKYCWRTITSFSNCRKFAAQSRIVPAE